MINIDGDDGGEYDRERLQELDAAWAAAWPPVQAAADALESDALGLAVAGWAACADKYVNAVPLDADGYRPAFCEHQELIWERMIKLKALGVALCKATQMRGKAEERRARNCVHMLTRAMGGHGCGHFLGDTFECSGWSDSDAHIDAYLHEPPLEGDVESTVMLRLALCGTYGHEHDEKCFTSGVLQRLEVDVDYLHRVLERVLHVVAVLGDVLVCGDDHDFAEQWRTRVYHASPTLGEYLGPDLTLNKVLNALLREPGTPPFAPDEATEQLKPVEHPAVRAMLKSVKSRDRRLITAIGSPDRPPQHTCNSLLWEAGFKHVRKAKKACWAAMYVKWRSYVRMRGITLYWQEGTAKRLCAPAGSLPPRPKPLRNPADGIDGAADVYPNAADGVGLATDRAAFGADMGVAA